MNLVVNLVRFGIRRVCICDFDVIVDVLELEFAKADGGNGRGSQGSDVLRMLDNFNRVAGDISENLS